jgi:hypothetical protein
MRAGMLRQPQTVTRRFTIPESFLNLHACAVNTLDLFGGAASKRMRRDEQPGLSFSIGMGPTAFTVAPAAIQPIRCALLFDTTRQHDPG